MSSDLPPDNTDMDATVVAPASASPQRLLDRYEVISVLGQGAMGLVYKAFDTVLERTVAIKTVKTELFDHGAQDEVLARFKREAVSSGQLSHPNIVAVYEYQEDQGTAYIVMEFVEGEELAEIIGRGEKLSQGAAIKLIKQVLSALAFVHEKGIVHRDIKPANLMINNNGDVKITDFGIAHVDTSSLTVEGSVIGTPSFMSPEQCQGQLVDARSDLFSCASVFYYLITGEKPFPGENSIATMQRVISEQALAPSALNTTLNKAYDQLLEKALSKKPDDRFQSASDFMSALDAITQPQKSQKSSKKFGLLVVIGLAIVALSALFVMKESVDSNDVEVSAIVDVLQPKSEVEKPIAIGLSVTSDKGERPVVAVEDKIVIDVTVARDAFVYCYLHDARQQLMRIYPNRFTPLQQTPANSHLYIPSFTDEFDVVMEVAESQEEVLCVASPTPLEDKVPGLAAEDDLTPLQKSLSDLRKEFRANTDPVSEVETLVIAVK